MKKELCTSLHFIKNPPDGTTTELKSTVECSM